MKQTPLPSFDHQRCRSTGWCVAVCPVDCLDMWNDRPYLKFPQHCVSCSACVLVCPVDAVSIPEVSAQQASAEPRESKSKQG